MQDFMDTLYIYIYIYIAIIAKPPQWPYIKRISRNSLFVQILVQINYCDWFAWCMVTAVALLLLLNDKCKPESLQRDGRPGWRFPQTAGCKARTCFIDSDKWRQIPSIGVFHQCWHQLKNFEKQRKGLRTVSLNFWLVKAGHCYFRLFVP